MQSLQSHCLFIQHHSLIHGKPVTFCPTLDRLHCHTDWNVDQMIFVDPKKTGVRDPRYPILRFIQYNPHEGKLAWKGFDGKHYLTAVPHLFSSHTNGRFTYRPSKGQAKEAKEAVALINRVGRFRILSH